MVPMSSWSLGLSIDMGFVKFGRRLVSFPFLGCFGKLPRSRDDNLFVFSLHFLLYLVILVI